MINYLVDSIVVAILKDHFILYIQFFCPY